MRSRIPVVTGEALLTRADFRPIFRARAADIINPDVSNCGGILELMYIAAAAETEAIAVSPHNYNSTTLALSATVHASACMPNFIITEYFLPFEEIGASSAPMCSSRWMAISRCRKGPALAWMSMKRGAEHSVRSNIRRAASGCRRTKARSARSHARSWETSQEETQCPDEAYRYRNRVFRLHRHCSIVARVPMPRTPILPRLSGSSAGAAPARRSTS